MKRSEKRLSMLKDLFRLEFLAELHDGCKDYQLGLGNLMARIDYHNGNVTMYRLTVPYLGIYLIDKKGNITTDGFTTLADYVDKVDSYIAWLHNTLDIRLANYLASLDINKGGN